MLADAKIKDCHPKCLGKYRSRPRCNVKRLFAPNSHLAKLKTREVANITHLQNVDARRGDRVIAVSREKGDRVPKKVIAYRVERKYFRVALALPMSI